MQRNNMQQNDTPRNPLFDNTLCFSDLYLSSREVNHSYNSEYIPEIKIHMIHDIYELQLGSYRVTPMRLPAIKRSKFAEFIRTFSVEYFNYITEICTKINRRRMQHELMRVYGHKKQISLMDELCDDMKWLVEQKLERVETSEELCANFVYFITFSIDNRMPDKHLFTQSFLRCKSVLSKEKFNSIILKASRDRKRIFVEMNNPREDLFFDNQYEAYKAYVTYYSVRERFWDTQFIVNEQKKYEALMDKMWEETAEDIDDSEDIEDIEDSDVVG